MLIRCYGAVRRCPLDEEEQGLELHQMHPCGGGGGTTRRTLVGVFICSVLGLVSAVRRLRLSRVKRFLAYILLRQQFVL
jgi:hypothetical protein